MNFHVATAADIFTSVNCISRMEWDMWLEPTAAFR